MADFEYLEWSTQEECVARRIVEYRLLSFHVRSRVGRRVASFGESMPMNRVAPSLQSVDLQEVSTKKTYPIACPTRRVHCVRTVFHPTSTGSPCPEFLRNIQRSRLFFPSPSLLRIAARGKTQKPITLTASCAGSPWLPTFIFRSRTC